MRQALHIVGAVATALFAIFGFWLIAIWIQLQFFN
jgi:hypothetical protein